MKARRKPELDSPAELHSRGVAPAADAERAASRNYVKVSIARREFTIACDEEERRDVIEAAAHLDRQMREVAKGKALGVDRCAIMAALNISHEFLQLQKTAQANQKLDARLATLHDQVDEVVVNLHRAADPAQHKK